MHNTDRKLAETTPGQAREPRDTCPVFTDAYCDLTPQSRSETKTNLPARDSKKAGDQQLTSAQTQAPANSFLPAVDFVYPETKTGRNGTVDDPTKKSTLTGTPEDPAKKSATSETLDDPTKQFPTGPNHTPAMKLQAFLETVLTTHDQDRDGTLSKQEMEMVVLTSKISNNPNRAALAETALKHFDTISAFDETAGTISRRDIGQIGNHSHFEETGKWMSKYGDPRVSNETLMAAAWTGAGIGLVAQGASYFTPIGPAVTTIGMATGVVSGIGYGVMDPFHLGSGHAMTLTIPSLTVAGIAWGPGIGAAAGYFGTKYVANAYWDLAKRPAVRSLLDDLKHNVR